MRSVLLPAVAAVMMSATTAMADNKSDCQKGVAMIKAELKKKTSDARARHIAQGAQRCRDRGDRGGLLVRVHGPHQDRARRAQQVSATPNE
jgi:hypothetical protein